MCPSLPMTRHRIVVAVLLGALVAFLAAAAPSAAAPSSSPLFVEVVTVSGVLDPAQASTIYETVARAERTGAELVLIELDSGGTVGLGLSAVTAVYTARVPVAVYI